MKKIIFSLLIFCLITCPAMSKDLFEYGGSKIYGEFKNYDDGEDNNGESLTKRGAQGSLTRTYLTGYMNFNDKNRIRLTLDSGGYEKHSSGFYKNSWVFVKYLYLEMKDVLGADRILIGQHGHPWIDYADKIWGYRVISKSFLEDQKIAHSADRGLGIIKTVNGALEYAISFVGGEGYKHDDANSVINTEARFTHKVEEGFEYSLGGGTGAKAVNWPYDEYYTFRYGAFNVNYKRASWIFSYTALGTFAETDQNGESRGKGSSAVLVWNAIGKYDLIGRIDKFDPDLQVADDQKVKTIMGVAYKLDKSLKFVLSKQTELNELTATVEHINQFNIEAKF